MEKHNSLRGATTGIGSLPHHNIDAALAYAFSFDIPFLPQIPMRNPWEFSVPQGLDGLPGVRVEKDGSALVDASVWVGRAKAFEEKLTHAFEQTSDPAAFEGFEPSAASSSSWQPFLWELQERSTLVAKIQTVGPLTAQWTLRSTDGARLDQNEDIQRQIFRLVLARSLGMTRRLKSLNVHSVLFLDEPALFVLSEKNPSHLLGLQELRLLVQALQKESVVVGMHCCSNIHWPSVLGLGLDILSFDTTLSLASVFEAGESLDRFIASGGTLCLGAIPTADAAALSQLSPRQLKAAIRDSFSARFGAAAESVLARSLWSPACGLALHTPKDAELILSLLSETRSA